MDFAIPAATEELLARVRAFVERELYPLEPLLFAGRWAEVEAAVMAGREEVKRQGLWAPALPRELGGMGLELVDFGLVSEALGASPLGHLAFGCQAPDAGNLEILHRHASAEQRARWLEPLAAGAIRSCFAMTEPGNPGSNPVLLSTRATEVPAAEGGGWVIDGHKWFVSSADGAALAVVMAVTDPEAPPHRRASMLLVPTDAPGFEIARNLPVMGDAGAGWFSHAEVRLAGCRVGPEALLGARGEGFAIAQERLGAGRIHHCMRWLGICARALELMCRRAAAREVAPGERLADKDLVRAWIAECAAEVKAARLLTLHAAWTIERAGWRAARAEISMIKFTVAAALGRVLDRALQVHGGLGMLDDTPLAWFWRHERAARIYDGPDEVHKLALARELLRPHRE
jgi:alkylation response protein AidB-like acyl-CoA dehydrogenase